MYCNKCGSQLSDDAVFCTECGASQKNETLPLNNTVLAEPAEVNQNQQHNGQNAQVYGGNGAAFPYQQGTPYPPQNGGYSPQGGRIPPIYYPPSPPPEKKGNKGIVIVLIVLTVIIIALCGVLLFFVMNGDRSSPDSSDDEITSEIDRNDDDEDIRTTTLSKTKKPVTKTVAEPSTLFTTQPTTAKPTGFSGIQQLANGKQPLNISYVSSDVSNYPLVKVYFTAEDNSGNAVTLSSPNVGIREIVSGGKEAEREVKSIEQLKGKEGVSFALVADKSGSMSYDLPQMQRIMSEFVDALDYRSGDRAELIAFDTYVMYMCTYTNEPQLLKNGINNMSAYGMTALYDALYEAVLNSGAQKGARCVIAFTDGDDTESSHTANEVIQRANELSVPIFIIGTNGSLSDYNRIAENTGGQYWNINNISDMNQILDQIYAQEKEMYCVEYVSDSKEEAIKERKISLAVADENYGGVTEMQFKPTEARKEAAHSSRYEFIKADVNWAEANAECIKRGGHLITITSDAELKTAVDLAEANGAKYVWMGGYTSVRNGTAYGHWITGELFDYQKWYPGEPSRDDVDGTPEMYLMLWNVDSTGWTWNDQRDDLFTPELAHIFNGKSGYICEYES